MDGSAFRYTTRDAILFWGIVGLVAFLLLGTGFILGRLSTDWKRPHIEWR